ncbi:autophagy protein [Kickxella alabastrina]|uniref:Autophagy protein n=1 Tax=Kickxella alabastrina TaxID=61397 RepID=A0ACC1IIN7_9FUNG|nr:autophagy protein [Kickxella alabastrina]
METENTVRNAVARHRCKRCSRNVQFADSTWRGDTLGDAPSFDKLIHTLPEERSRELSALIAAQNQNSNMTELSRFFSQSLRTDTVPRLSNGTIARALPGSTPATPLMQGSMALVLEAGKNEETKITAGSPVSDADGMGELTAGSGSSQGDSFIILSSSQVRSQKHLANFAFERRAAMQQSAGLADSEFSKAAGVAGAPPVAGQGDDITETFEIIGRLMDRLDERSALGHPMCEDCAEIMLRLLDREVSDSARERDILEDVGRAAKLAAKSHNTGDLGELEEELERQGDLEQALEETLGTLDAQLEGICAQISNLDAESDKLAKMEAQFYQELNDRSHVLETCEAEQWALDERYARLASQLSQLQRTNVYNDVFNISVSEGVAGINGFRLGGRSSHSVEWPEINAAWGQALLLLQTVARKLGYEFIDYRLIPMGSFSRIERMADPPATYELFGSGDMYLGRLFQNRKFDSAMVAYLACLDQIVQLIMSINPQLRVPYKIEQDKVGGLSIRPQFGQDDMWTKACKNTLLDARWALAFASSYSGNSN